MTAYYFVIPRVNISIFAFQIPRYNEAVGDYRSSELSSAEATWKPVYQTVF